MPVCSPKHLRTPPHPKPACLCVCPAAHLLRRQPRQPLQRVDLGGHTGGCARQQHGAPPGQGLCLRGTQAKQVSEHVQFAPAHMSTHVCVCVRVCVCARAYTCVRARAWIFQSLHVLTMREQLRVSHSLSCVANLRTPTRTILLSFERALRFVRGRAAGGRLLLRLGFCACRMCTPTCSCSGSAKQGIPCTCPHLHVCCVLAKGAAEHTGAYAGKMGQDCL